jgi:hypothetical protein
MRPNGADLARAHTVASAGISTPCRVFDPEIAAATASAHFGGSPTLRLLER